MKKPQDATLRNIRALKAKLKKLEAANKKRASSKIDSKDLLLLLQDLTKKLGEIIWKKESMS